MYEVKEKKFLLNRSSRQTGVVGLHGWSTTVDRPSSRLATTCGVHARLMVAMHAWLGWQDRRTRWLVHQSITANDRTWSPMHCRMTRQPTQHTSSRRRAQVAWHDSQCMRASMCSRYHIHDMTAQHVQLACEHDHASTWAHRPFSRVCGVFSHRVFILYFSFIFLEIFE